MSKRSIDINCDVGELEEVNDLDFIPYVSSVNVCCGEHAGNPEKILAAIRAAKKYGAKVGAHPSYPDRDNFGRKSMDINRDELLATLIEQIVYIQLLCQKENVEFHHVKPHGALYHDIANREDRLDIFLDAVRVINPALVLYVRAEKELLSQLSRKGWQYKAEGFLDRAYNSDGTLVSRNKENAVLKDWKEVKVQLKNLISGKVRSLSNDAIDLNFDTLCVHSDTPAAASWVKNIPAVFLEEEIQIG